MMKNKRFFVGSDGRAIVWRFRSPGSIEFLAIEKHSQGLVVSCDGSARLALVNADAIPFDLATQIVQADDPRKVIEDLANAGKIKFANSPVVPDPFFGKWADLVKPQAEKEIFESQPVTTIQSLEF